MNENSSGLFESENHKIEDENSKYKSGQFKSICEENYHSSMQFNDHKTMIQNDLYDVEKNFNNNKKSLLSEPLSPSKTINVTKNNDYLSNQSFNIADVYQQFDQLAFRTTAESIDLKRIRKHNNQTRDRVKSFIEFEDDDYDEDAQNISSQQNNDLTKITNKVINEYKNDLINVFSKVQQNNENTNIKNDDDKNNDNDDDRNYEEWNDFQTSEPQTMRTKSISSSIEKSDHHNIDYNEPLPCSINRKKCTDTSSDSNESNVFDTESNLLYGRLNKMEQEQELLNNSLVALTSHFAQVQLRLRQIVEAKNIDVEKREMLLAELETFANRGIPELMLTSNPSHNLERSVSMATSLMADDVFDDEDGQDNHDDNSRFLTNSNLETDFENRSGKTRSSWSYSQGDCDSVNVKHNSTSTMLITEEKLERQRSRQKELIAQLKNQLEDLERYAYETGELNSLPSSMLLERQNAIIEQIKSKLPIFSIDEIDKLTPDELRRKVDHAVKELVNPVIMKEQLVSQLKTQVTDLERFIEFLQQGGGKLKKKYKYNAQDGGSSYFMRFLQKKKSQNDLDVSVMKSSKYEPINNSENKLSHHNSTTTISSSSTLAKIKQNESSSKENNDSTDQQQPRYLRGLSNARIRNSMNMNENNNSTAAENIFKRILSLLYVFAWTQLGSCASFASYNDSRIPFEQNMLKKRTSYGRHWGDLRAHLEMAITTILDFYKDQSMQNHTTELGGSTEDSGDFIALGDTALVIDNYFAYEQMTILVRKELSVALRNLIHHGLIGCWIDSGHVGPSSISSLTNSTSTNAVGHFLNLGMGCFSTRSTPIIKPRPMHAWELIVYYYELKNGNKFRSTPTRRLSQSFGLQVVSGLQASPKHSLLAAIDDIIDSHTRFKRSLDSHFKAFVCRGLNQQMLSQWLRLILRNPKIVNECYEKWSYTTSTGFEDALRQLDKLSNLRFCLPTDLAVRKLQSIHDAF